MACAGHALATGFGSPGAAPPPFAPLPPSPPALPAALAAGADAEVGRVRVLGSVSSDALMTDANFNANNHNASSLCVCGQQIRPTMLRQATILMVVNAVRAGHSPSSIWCTGDVDTPLCNNDAIDRCESHQGPLDVGATEVYNISCPANTPVYCSFVQVSRVGFPLPFSFFSSFSFPFVSPASRPRPPRYRAPFKRLIP